MLVQHAIFQTTFAGMAGTKVYEEKDLRKMFPTIYDDVPTTPVNSLSGEAANNRMKELFNK